MMLCVTTLYTVQETECFVVGHLVYCIVATFKSPTLYGNDLLTNEKACTKISLVPRPHPQEGKGLVTFEHFFSIVYTQSAFMSQSHGVCMLNAYSM